MSNYEIKKADFEKQKNELKTFAEQQATSTELDKFSTDGQWSDFLTGGLAGLISGHKVTGEEMNSLVIKLQSCFAEINERDRKVIKEFGQVYETFEALDKGYIQGILIGVKSAEEASREAKQAQADIDDTIKALGITIDKLKSFKDQINSYEHLKDVDQIWEDLGNAENDLNTVSDKVEGIDKFVKEELKSLNKLKEKIGPLSLDLDKNEKKISEYETRLQEAENEKEKIVQRLNIAYVIAGSALGLTVVQIVLLLIGVL